MGIAESIKINPNEIPVEPSDFNRATTAEEVSSALKETRPDLALLTTDNTPYEDEYITRGGLFLVRAPVVYHIIDFDGPIDLLLELIRKAKISIDEIFISDVTSQYLEIVKSTPKEEFDYEYAGEFITMAAELVYIKSTHALPQEDDGEAPMNEAEVDFIDRIKAYELMQQQSLKLRDKETINRFTREPVFSDKDYRLCLVNFSMAKLIEAYARVLANSERAVRDELPRKVVKDRFSVQDQMRHIVELIGAYKSVDFISLFEPDFDRFDVVTTFLAVLELMKYGKLRAEQEEVFGNIILIGGEREDGSENLEVPDGEY